MGWEVGTLGAAYREKLGYLPQEFGFYPEFTVQDYLEYMAALKGLPRTEAARQIDALLERVSLTEVRRKKDREAVRRYEAPGGHRTGTAQRPGNSDFR